jgi:hypothetical protein
VVRRAGGLYGEKLRKFLVSATFRCGLTTRRAAAHCAEKIAAQILESGPGELAAEPCSGACREAIELYFSTPPERWRAPLTPRRP